MNHKYVIEKNSENNTLIIKEYIDLEKAIYHLADEEQYDLALLAGAAQESMESLIKAFRRRSFYIPGIYASRIAKAIKETIDGDGSEPLQVFCSDVEQIVKDKLKEEQAAEAETEEGVEIDDLLDDEFDKTDEKDIAPAINKSENKSD